MPTVKSGNKTKEFAYTKKGEQKAKQFAKKTGGKLAFKKGMKGRTKR